MKPGKWLREQPRQSGGHHPYPYYHSPVFPVHQGFPYPVQQALPVQPVHQVPVQQVQGLVPDGSITISVQQLMTILGCHIVQDTQELEFEDLPTPKLDETLDLGDLVGDWGLEQSVIQGMLRDLIDWKRDRAVKIQNSLGGKTDQSLNLAGQCGLANRKP